MWINLHVHPLNFQDVSLISNIFININKYANLIICVFEHWMKVMCLNIQLVPSLKVSDELLKNRDLEHILGASQEAFKICCIRNIHNMWRKYKMT